MYNVYIVKQKKTHTYPRTRQRDEFIGTVNVEMITATTTTTIRTIQIKVCPTIIKKKSK